MLAIVNVFQFKYFCSEDINKISPPFFSRNKKIYLYIGKCVSFSDGSYHLWFRVA